MDSALEQQLGRLLQQAQAGDRVAYAQFLQQAREVVRVFLLRRGAGPSLLDDLLQETLLSIHGARHSYDPARPIGPWLRAIALNRLRDSGRARKRQHEHAGADLDWEQTRHATDATDADATPPTWLRGALDTLSEAQREVIWMLKFEGYSVAEIADQTGRSASAIKVTAHRGYRALRALLRSR